MEKKNPQAETKQMITQRNYAFKFALHKHFMSKTKDNYDVYG